MTQNMDCALEVRLADSEREIHAAQALRYKVFHQDMGAKTASFPQTEGRDIDRFDDFCDHLIVIDHKEAKRDEAVVGTYRLLRSSKASDTIGYYSDSEFDLTPLNNLSGEKLELGRSCVNPSYRNKAVLQLLWSGISKYLEDNNIRIMFGCASFPGTELQDISTALSYLAFECAAPTQWRPRALPERYLDMRMVEADQLDLRQAMREMPPLIKGYLRLGGVVGDGAVIDADFNTVDVCLLVETDIVPSKYRRPADYSDTVQQLDSQTLSVNV